MESKGKSKTVLLTFQKAVVCIIALIVVLCVGFAVLGLDTKVVFLIASAVVGMILVGYGFSKDQVLEWYADGGRGAIDVILILMSVGAVIGTWMASGTIPTIMYYGLKLLTPASFMVIGFLICCIVSFFIGSSYSTLATLGVAFIGIGTGLGMNLGLVAGMVVSGALFGDKMSPFSDTTNLAAAVSGTTVYKHIGSMLYTVIPALVLTFMGYVVLSMGQDTSAADMSRVEDMLNGLDASFNISPVLFLVPIFVLTLALFKIPPVIAMVASAFFAIILGAFTQRGYVDLFTLIQSSGNGFSIEIENADLARLLNRGGIAGMMETVAWTILTLGMGNTLKESGVLNAFLVKLLAFIKKPKALVISTLGFSLVCSMLTASQYLAIMLPGMLLKDEYTEFGLDKKVLSRTLEDGGTMFSFLVPWDTAAIYTASVLGISALQYAPYAFLLILCPLIAAIYALVGFAQFKDPEAAAEK